MSISRLLAWLRKQAPDESDMQRMERLMNGLASADTETQIGAKTVFKAIVYNQYADYSPAYTCAVLQALGQRSDLQDYGWVLRLVEYLGQPLAEVRIDPEVRAAAAVCIQRLKERYEPEYAANSLLHIPAGLQAAGDLLRPAQNQTEMQPETLLRAAGPETPSNDERS